MFKGLFSTPEFHEAIQLVVFMTVGGLLGFFVRALYLRFSSTVSNRDRFSATFPLLTVGIILVIFVIKSSLALSLGLVGALSIVRFRAAIKEPEEIIYLFMCIALGLALGAEYLQLALGGAAVFTAYVLIVHWRRRKHLSDQLMLTITGSKEALAPDGDLSTFSSQLEELAGTYKLQRLDVEDGQVQCRIIVFTDTPMEISEKVEKITGKWPNTSVSYVNLENLL